jgi:signal transduction histidine kinase
MTLGSNEAVVASAIDETRHIEGILRVLPETTDIVVAIGDSPPERFWKVLLQHSFERFAGRVNFHWLNGLSANEMISRAANLPPRHAIYYATVRVDAAGAPQEGDRVLLRFFETARAPVFTYVDSHLGEGIVGGPMISSDELAGKVAAAARRILDGESPSAVTTPPVGDAPPVYDWRQLQRWKIAESALPPGSIVKFREVTTWQQYRLEILAVVAVILLQGVLITVLMYEHRRRTLAEIQSRESILELSRLNRFAAAGELSASLAHEIGQPITGIELLAGAARQCLASPKPDVEKVRSLLDQISRAGREAHDMIKSVRGMFRNDGPTKKAPIDINSLLRKMLAIADIELRADRIRVEIDFDDDLTPVEGNAIQLQQIVLNLIINAREAMRGETSRVLTIQSTQSLPGVVEVLIGDTGQGIPPEERERIFDPLFTTKTSGMGMGLSICRSIIEGHGGRLWVTSGGNKGAVLHFELRSIVAERPDVELPAAASDVTVGQPEEPEADAPPPRRARRAAGHAA